MTGLWRALLQMVGAPLAAGILLMDGTCGLGGWQWIFLNFILTGLGPALQMLGAPLAAGILLMDGTCGLRGWQWIFLIEGSATVAFAGVLVLLLPKNPASARFLTPAESTWLTSRQERLLETAKEKDPTRGTWHCAGPPPCCSTLVVVYLL
jgi:hypothetical protein